MSRYRPLVLAALAGLSLAACSQGATDGTVSASASSSSAARVTPVESTQPDPAQPARQALQASPYRSYVASVAADGPGVLSVELAVNTSLEDDERVQGICDLLDAAGYLQVSVHEGWSAGDRSCWG